MNRVHGPGGVPSPNQSQPIQKGKPSQALKESSSKVTHFVLSRSLQRSFDHQVRDKSPHPHLDQELKGITRDSFKRISTMFKGVRTTTATPHKNAGSHEKPTEALRTNSSRVTSAVLSRPLPKTGKHKISTMKATKAGKELSSVAHGTLRKMPRLT